MSTPTLIYFLGIIACLPAAVSVTGRPSIRVRNATALAMVATWLFSRLVWFLTGEWLPLQAMFVEDMVVIGAMFTKDDWYTCPYKNGWHQIACLWLERTPWDKAILALFPLAWLLYTPILEPTLQFWVLWSLSLGQLILAGLEGFHLHLAGNGQMLRAADDRPPGLEFTAWSRSHV